jgi:hypothetical protein
MADTMTDANIMERDGISKIDVHPTMEAAWQELESMFFANLTRAQKRDARFMFFTGVRAATNLIIFSAGASGNIEGAINQIVGEIEAYRQTEGGELLGQLS